MSSIFQTKSVDDLLKTSEGSAGLKRTLNTFDLVMLGIGAIVGAGIFSSIGTAAVGEIAADGTVIRYGAGPALMLSFVLLGAVCALAGLCYAELTAMIPVSGSAYTYAYATLGELVAWIIGWDLILEYAVGNIAVAIAWSGYFASLLRFFGIYIPFWLCHSYRDVALSYPDRMSDLPLVFGHHIAINIPAIVIVGLITWLLVVGVKESARANSVMVVIKLSVLALFIGVGFFHIEPANWEPFAPNGWRGIMNGAAIVFFAYIGFDAISTAAEETKDPQRSMPRGILGALAICTCIYVVVGAVATGIVPYTQLKGSDPLARAFGTMAGIGWGQAIIAFGAVVSMAGVLLVFQYGQPRIFYAMSRDGLLPPFFRQLHPKYRTPHVTTIVTGLLVALGATILDDDETYDLTNIGTLFAFLVVCIGVLALRIKDPNRHRPFRVPFVWLVAPLGAAGCLYTMYYLPTAAWERFGIWLVIGTALYFAYGRRHSNLGAGR